MGSAEEWVAAAVAATVEGAEEDLKWIGAAWDTKTTVDKADTTNNSISEIVIAHNFFCCRHSTNDMMGAAVRD